MNNFNINIALEKLYHHKLVKHHLADIEDMVELYSHRPRHLDYMAIPKDITKRLNDLLGHYSYQDIIKIFLTLFFETVKNRQLTGDMLPENIKREYQLYIERVYQQYLLGVGVSRDQMYKDLAIASGHAYATCLETVVPCYYPRKQLITSGLSGLYKFARVISKSKQWRPLMLQLHMNNRNRDFFNITAKYYQYKQIATILKSTNGYKGVFASSWWYDPKLGPISPQMAHYYDDALKSSAIILPCSISDGMVRSALTCPLRGKFYRLGEYTPRAFCVTWLKDDFIKRWL